MQFTEVFFNSMGESKTYINEELSIRRFLRLLLVVTLVTTAKAYAAPDLNKTQPPATVTNQEVAAEVVQTERPAKAEKKKPVSKPKKVKTKAKRVIVRQTVPTIKGNKRTWMRAAGIPESQWKYVDYIVSKESSWNPLAVNASSGACSLVQSLPCSKIPGDWRNPVNALKWQYSYVKARYGGYAQAYEFWRKNSWY